MKQVEASAWGEECPILTGIGEPYSVGPQLPGAPESSPGREGEYSREQEVAAFPCPPALSPGLWCGCTFQGRLVPARYLVPGEHDGVSATLVGVGGWAKSGGSRQTPLPGDCPVCAAGDSSHPHVLLEQPRSRQRP